MFILALSKNVKQLSISRALNLRQGKKLQQTRKCIHRNGFRNEKRGENLLMQRESTRSRTLSVTIEQ